MSWVRASRVAAVGIALGILVLSLVLRVPELTGRITFGDKLAHLVAYVLLALAGRVAFGQDRPPGVPLTAGLCAAYGGAIEILQRYTGRTPEILDWLSDAVGALVGALIGAWLARRLPARTSESSD